MNLKNFRNSIQILTLVASFFLTPEIGLSQILVKAKKVQNPEPSYRGQTLRLDVQQNFG